MNSVILGLNLKIFCESAIFVTSQTVSNICEDSIPHDMWYDMFDYLAPVKNVLIILKCGCGVGWVKVIGTSARHSSRSAFGRPTGNDVSGQ